MNLLQLNIAKGAAGRLADNNYKEAIEAPKLTGVDTPKIELPVTFDVSQNQIQQTMQRTKQMFAGAVPEFDFTSSAMNGLQSLSGIMGSLSGVVNDSAGAWLNWGASILQTIAQVIPQIIALTNTQVAAASVQMTANTGVAATGAAASVAAIPIVGWIMAGAAVASMLATLMSIPKPKAMANGAIAYGPTYALVGEYAGASNNPEVIAPLDKLQSLIRPAGISTDGLYLETKIRGKDLYVALQGVEHERRRTR